MCHSENKRLSLSLNNYQSYQSISQINGSIKPTNQRLSRWPGPLDSDSTLNAVIRGASPVVRESAVVSSLMAGGKTDMGQTT